MSSFFLQIQHAHGSELQIQKQIDRLLQLFFQHDLPRLETEGIK
jgi:hypothetical protein